MATVVTCRDWLAEYNPSIGVCECPAGYTDTDQGCTAWDNNENDAGDKLMVEIQRRLTHIHDEGSLSTINAKRLAAFERFFNNMEKKAGRKRGNDPIKRFPAENEEREKALQKRRNGKNEKREE